MRWLPLLLLVAACGKPALVSSTWGYAVDAERLDFGAGWVGFPAERRLEILSRTRATQRLEVAVDAPFTVDRAVVELPGGDAVTVVVRFAPLAAGAVTGRLVVGEVEVALHASAALPPDCGEAPACQRVGFDPLAGACVTTALDEGTACGGADTCIENGQCRGGACVGTLRSCDDGNACTQDACAPGQGCQHRDTSAACPAREDPCFAAVCDPARGCGAAPVADGTPCGEVSCVLANVCLQGRCSAVRPPDGFTCAPQSPCQDEGVCRSQACVQPAPHELQPAWSYTPQSDVFAFEGVSDPQGNLWWVECVEGETMSCQAVSFTRDGFLRFRAGATSGMSSRQVTQLFDEGRFVYATSSGEVVALNGLTGAEVWRTNLRLPLGTSQYGGWPTDLYGLRLSSDGRGHLWATAPFQFLRCDVDPNTAALPRALVQVDAATGRVTKSIVGELLGDPVIDESGNLYAALVTGGPGRLTSFTPQGAERFTTTVDGGAEPLVSVGQGRVVLESNRGLSAAAGGELAPWRSAEQLSPSALQVGGATVRLRSESLTDLPPSLPFTELVLFDAATPEGRTLATVAGPNAQVTLPVLAGDGTVVVAGRVTAAAQLKGITLGGVERFACTLPELPSALDSVLAPLAGFTGDRFALVSQPVCPTCLRAPPPVLRVFNTTGLGLPTTGWGAPRGTPGNAGRAR